ADAMLPLVRSIVKDIAELAPSVRDRHERLKRLQRGGVAKGVVTGAQLEEEEAALEHDRERLEECLGDLSELGVEMKDPFVGLIDFPCWKDGREIYLCWKLGEARLGHWHEVNAGFAGRRPLDQRSEIRGQNSDI